MQGWLRSSQGLVPSENEHPLFKNYSELKALNRVRVPMEQAPPVLVEGAGPQSVRVEWSLEPSPWTPTQDCINCRPHSAQRRVLEPRPSNLILVQQYLPPSPRWGQMT